MTRESGGASPACRPTAEGMRYGRLITGPAGRALRLLEPVSLSTVDRKAPAQPPLRLAEASRGWPASVGIGPSRVADHTQAN